MIELGRTFYMIRIDRNESGHFDTSNEDRRGLLLYVFSRRNVVTLRFATRTRSYKSEIEIISNFYITIGLLFPSGKKNGKKEKAYVAPILPIGRTTDLAVFRLLFFHALI